MRKIVFFRPKARKSSTTADTTCAAGTRTPWGAVYRISLLFHCLGSLLVTFCLSRQRCNLPVFQLSVETSRPDSSRWPFPDFSDVRFDHKRSRLPSVLCESAIPFWCSCLTQFTHSRSVSWSSQSTPLSSVAECHARRCPPTCAGLRRRAVVTKSRGSCTFLSGPLTGRQAPLQPSGSRPVASGTARD